MILTSKGTEITLLGDHSSHNFQNQLETSGESRRDLKDKNGEVQTPFSSYTFQPVVAKEKSFIQPCYITSNTHMDPISSAAHSQLSCQVKSYGFNQNPDMRVKEGGSYISYPLMEEDTIEKQILLMEEIGSNLNEKIADLEIQLNDVTPVRRQYFEMMITDIKREKQRELEHIHKLILKGAKKQTFQKIIDSLFRKINDISNEISDLKELSNTQTSSHLPSIYYNPFRASRQIDSFGVMRRSYSASNIHPIEKTQPMVNISRERQLELIFPRDPQIRIPFNDVKLVQNQVSSKINENQLTLSQVLNNYYKSQAQSKEPFVSSNIQDTWSDRDLQKKINSSSNIQEVPVESLNWQGMNGSLRQCSSVQQAPQNSQFQEEQHKISQYYQETLEQYPYYESPQLQQLGHQVSNTGLEEQSLVYQNNSQQQVYKKQKQYTSQNDDDDNSYNIQSSQQQAQIQSQQRGRNFAEASVQTSFSLAKGFGSYFNAKSTETPYQSASHFSHQMDDESIKKVLQSAIALAATIPSQHSFPREESLHYDQSQINKVIIQQELSNERVNSHQQGSIEGMDGNEEIRSDTYSSNQQDQNNSQHQESSQISNSKLFSAQQMKDSQVSSRYSQQTKTNHIENFKNIAQENQQHDQATQSEYEKKELSTTGLTTTSWTPQSIERDFSGLKQQQQGNQMQYSINNSAKNNGQSCLKSEEKSRLLKVSDDKITQCFEDIRLNEQTFQDKQNNGYFIQFNQPTSTFSQQQQDQHIRPQEEELKRKEVLNKILPQRNDQSDENQRKNSQNQNTIDQIQAADFDNKNNSLQSPPPTSLFQYLNPTDTNQSNNNNSRYCDLTAQQQRQSHISVNQGEYTNVSEVDIHSLNSVKEKPVNRQFEGTHLERLNESNLGRIRGQQSSLNPNVISQSHNRPEDFDTYSKESADNFNYQKESYYAFPDPSNLHAEQDNPQITNMGTQQGNQTIFEMPEQHHHSLSQSNGNSGKFAIANYSNMEQGKINQCDPYQIQKSGNQDQEIMQEQFFFGQVKARYFADKEEYNIFNQQSPSDENQELVEESGFANCELFYQDTNKHFTLLAQGCLLPQNEEGFFILTTFPSSSILPQCLEIVSSPNNEPSLQIISMDNPSGQVCFILIQEGTDSDFQVKRQSLEHLRSQILKILSFQRSNEENPEIIAQLNESDSFTQNPISSYKGKHLNQPERQDNCQIQQVEVLEAGNQNNEVRNSIKSGCSDLKSSKLRQGQDQNDSMIIASQHSQFRQENDQIQIIPQNETQTIKEISMNKSNQSNIGKVISENQAATQTKINQQKEYNSSPYENLKSSQKQNVLSSIQKVAEDGDEDDELILQTQSQINEFKAISVPINNQNRSFQQNQNLFWENKESMQVEDERESEIIKANQPHYLMFNHHRYQVFTGRTQEEEQMITFFKKFDEKEFIMKKYGQNSSSPQLRRLFFSSDFRFFCWKSPNQPDIKRIIPIYMIGNYILHGRSTDNFKRYKNLKQSQIDCCFSIIMENRTIDLEALSLDDKDLFIQGLQFVFLAFQ